jgi:hypothetical protein
MRYSWVAERLPHVAHRVQGAACRCLAIAFDAETGPGTISRRAILRYTRAYSNRGLREFQTLARVVMMTWSKVSSSFMKTITVLFALFTLASCIAAPRTDFMGPNGKMVYAISCQTLDECAIEARELCPSGHDIVPSASGAGDTTARGGIGDTPAKKLLIECKAPSP